MPSVALVITLKRVIAPLVITSGKVAMAGEARSSYDFERDLEWQEAGRLL